MSEKEWVFTLLIDKWYSILWLKVLCFYINRGQPGGKYLLKGGPKPRESHYILNLHIIKFIFKLTEFMMCVFCAFITEFENEKTLLLKTCLGLSNLQLSFMICENRQETKRDAVWIKEEDRSHLKKKDGAVLLSASCLYSWEPLKPGSSLNIKINSRMITRSSGSIRL